MPFIPNIEQRDLLLAQNYLVKINNIDTDANEPNDKNLKEYNPDSLLEEQEKEAYKKVYNEISYKTSPSSLIESFISEKSYDVDHLKENKKTVLNTDVEKIAKFKIKEEITKTVEDINNLIMKFKIDKVKSVDYEKETKNFKKYKIEPGMKDMKKRPKGVSTKNYKL